MCQIEQLLEIRRKREDVELAKNKIKETFIETPFTSGGREFEVNLKSDLNFQSYRQQVPHIHMLSVGNSGWFETSARVTANVTKRSALLVIFGTYFMIYICTVNWHFPG